MNLERLEALMEAWAQGALGPEEAEAFEGSLEDPAIASAFADWTTREAALLRETQQGADPFRSSLEDPDGPAGRALAAAMDGLFPQPVVRPRPALVIGVAVAAAAAIVLGLTLVLPETATRPDVAAISEVLCEQYRTEGQLRLEPALACGEPVDLLLGVGGGGLVAQRDLLDGDPRPDDAEWLRARTMLALLLRDADLVIELLEANEALLVEHPDLRSHLAEAWLMKNHPDRALHELEKGLRESPDHPLLLNNLRRLP